MTDVKTVFQRIKFCARERPLNTINVTNLFASIIKMILLATHKYRPSAVIQQITCMKNEIEEGPEANVSLTLTVLVTF